MKSTERKLLEQEYATLEKLLGSIDRTLQDALDRAAKLAELKGEHKEARLGSLHIATLENSERILKRMEALQDQLNKLPR